MLRLGWLFYCVLLVRVLPVSAQFIYGQCSVGGTYGDGVFFEFNIRTGQFREVHHCGINFCSGPGKSLVALPPDYLFGTTTIGGMGSEGDIFRLETGSGYYYSLQSLNQSNGRLPYGGLMRASNGMLYGMTTSGGDYDLGTLFLYDPVGFFFDRLYSFNGSEGRSPESTVCEGPDGKLYGTTGYGGNRNMGVLFCFDPLTGSYSVLHHFEPPSGAAPLCGPMYQDGSIWGLCYTGGQFGLGVLYRYDINSSNYRVEFSFDRINGAFPTSPLIPAGVNEIYGITSQGGLYDQGAIFRYSTAHGIYQKLHDFEGNNGDLPMGPLLVASDGQLYGTTQLSGTHGYGTLFRFDPDSLGFEVLFNFDRYNGIYPQGSLVEYPVSIGILNLPQEYFLLAPIPSNGNIRYEFPANRPAIRLRVITSTGIEVTRIEEPPSEGRLQLASGFYTVMLEWADRPPICRKIVIE